MKYDTNKRKLFSVDQNENQNLFNGENLIKSDLIEKPENVTKKIQVINLIKKYNFTFGIVSTPFDSRVKVIFGGPEQIGTGGGMGE
jgi:hypothetical protein